MDPWADESAEAGPSWSAPASGPDKAAASSSPTHSPVRLRADVPSADPWASDRFAGEEEYATASSSREASRDSQIAPTSSHSQQDVDPWGGGSFALPSTSLAGTTLAEQENDDGGLARPAIARDASDGWGGGFSSAPTLATDDPSFVASQEERIDPPAGDDDDPWGSGARAARLKEEKDAEAAARQMEILRLQEESKGQYKEDSDQGGTGGQDTAAIHDNQPSTSSKEDTPAPSDSDQSRQTAAQGGWRSFFTRSSAKTSAPAKEEPVAQNTETSGEDKKSPTTAAATVAPRLWQAPTLGGHQRSASSSSQSKEQPNTEKTSGPGWSMAPKKPAPPAGGGFMSGFLGGGQRSSLDAEQGKGGSLEDARRSAQSKLDQIRQSLQPPQTVSAADDDDDQGPIEDTSLEFDSSEVFDAKKTASLSVPAQDLLGDDEKPTAQQSAVGRLFGRWRAGPKETLKKDTPAAESMSKDDLSWLEAVGTSSSSSQASNSKGQAADSAPQQNAEEEDWMAFVEGKPAEKGPTRSADRYDETASRPMAAYRDDMLSYDESVDAASAPGSRNPVQSSRYFYDEDAADLTPRKGNVNSFPAFEDSSTDDSVKSTDANAMRVSRSSAGIASHQISRSTASPSLSPSNSIRKATIHIPSPPRASRPSSAASTGGKLPPPPPASRHIAGSQLHQQIATPLQQAPSSSASATSSPQSMHSGLAVGPFASSQQRPPTAAANKTLSKGSTLTQDDLSFFENL